MQGLLDHRLLVLTGKGGVGRTTLAGALALAAAERGRRTLVVEVGDQQRLADLFAVRRPEPGEVGPLSDGIDSLTLDPDRALLEWLQALGGRVSGRILASSGTFQYFAAAAPGARELVTMVKLWRLSEPQGRSKRPAHDLVILDAPATGHALGLLRSPRTFGAIARVGPIVGQTDKLQQLLTDPQRSAYVAVAQGTDMAVTETLELEQGLQDALGRGLRGVIVNGLLPRRFSAAELALVHETAAKANGGLPIEAAAHAAEAVHRRASLQHSQLTRLRRRGFEVLGLPFLWQPEMDLEGVRELAARLGRGL